MPPTRVETFHINGRQLDLHAPFERFDDLVDDALDTRRGDFPWWAMVWPAALALAEHLDEPRPGAGRVIELGCGLGLPGLTAAQLGYEVTVTDNEPRALELVRKSARANGLELAGSRPLDWTRPGPQGVPLDLVIGADILYDRGLFEALFQLLPRLLARDGSALLSDPRREGVAAFLERLSVPFRLTTSTREVWHRDVRTTVDIHELRRG